MLVSEVYAVIKFDSITLIPDSIANVYGSLSWYSSIILFEIKILY